MPDAFPSLAIRYSKLSRLGYGIAVLILGYGGVGMVFGLIGAETGDRTQQVLIGLVFLAGALACALPFVRMFKTGSDPVLIVDPAGLWDRRLTREPIPWPAIAQIEGIAPSFMERLAMPGSKAGKILVHLAPEAAGTISFNNGTIAPLHAWLLAGPGKLRIFHSALDAQFPLLMDALIDCRDAVRKSDADAG